MGREEAHRAQGYFINCAYIFGVLPFWYYGEKGRIVDYPKSELSKVRWWSTIVICLLGRSVVFTQVIYDYIIDNFPLIPINFYRLYFLAFYAFSGGLHIHTVWKYDEILCVLNSNHAYYDYFCEHYANKFANDVCGVVMKILLGVCLFLTLLMTLLYTANCQLHFLTYVLPICETEESSILQGIYVLLQLAISLESMGSTFIYMGFPIPAIYAGCDMVRELENLGATSKTNPILQTHEHWFHHYRSCQLMVTQFNNCISEILIPAQLAAISGLAVVSNFILLKVHGFILLYICCSGASLNMCGFLYVSMKEGSQFWELSKIVLERRKEECDSLYLVQKLKACPPFGGKIGSFGMVDKSMLFITYGAIVSYTISLCLAY